MSHQQEMVFKIGYGNFWVKPKPLCHSWLRIDSEIKLPVEEGGAPRGHSRLSFRVDRADRQEPDAYEPRELLCR